ncbi:unnamed protein product, partial [Allacma fusca]
IRTLN